MSNIAGKRALDTGIVNVPILQEKKEHERKNRRLNVSGIFI
jgi:hypothetical protein